VVERRIDWRSRVETTSFKEWFVFLTLFGLDTWRFAPLLDQWSVAETNGRVSNSKLASFFFFQPYFVLHTTFTFERYPVSRIKCSIQEKT